MEHALSPALAPAAEEGPLNFEDLPNDILGVIMRKLAVKDKLSLTQASPSVRRLCVGERADPGILGTLELHFDTDRSVPVKVIAFSYRAVVFDPEAALFDELFNSALTWVQARSKAFDKLEISVYKLPVSADVASSVVKRIFAALSPRFSGPLIFSPSLLEPRIASFLLELCASFPSNRKELLRIHSDFNVQEPYVSDFFRQLTGIETLWLDSPSGKWDPVFFSLCDVRELSISDCSRVSNLRLPFQWKNLEYLELGLFRSDYYTIPFETIDLDRLFASLSPSSLASLKVVKLGLLDEDEFFERLQVLETLPALTSLELRIDMELKSVRSRKGKASSRAPSVPKHSPLRLPTVEFLDLKVTYTWPADCYRDYMLSPPLCSFQCENLRYLTLVVDTEMHEDDHMDEDDHESEYGSPLEPEISVSVQIDANAFEGLPSLQCLCFDTEIEWFDSADPGFPELRVMFDLSAADLTLTPDLAFVSILSPTLISSCPVSL